MRRPATAVVVIGALVAVTLAATGGAVAGTLITSTQIKDGTIVGADVRNGGLTGADVKDGSLSGVDVKDGTLGIGDLKGSARAVLSEWVNVGTGFAPIDNFEGAQVRSASPGLDGQVQAIVKPGGNAPGVFCIYFTPTALNRLNLEGVSLTVQRSINRPAFGTATSVFAHDACTGTQTRLVPPDPLRSYDVAVDTFTVTNTGSIVPTDVAFVLEVPRR
jgi:hypothetical protein